MHWEWPLNPGTTGRPAVPTVVLKGLSWRMVAMYLQRLGGRLVEPEDLQGGKGKALLSGDGWQAMLHEQVEFRGAMRSNRVEIRLSGNPQAIEGVVEGLRRLASMESLD